MLVICHNDIDTMTMNIMNEYIYMYILIDKQHTQHTQQHKTPPIEIFETLFQISVRLAVYNN